MPAIQASACQAGEAKGPPTISPRTALDRYVTGLTFTQACSQPGRVWVGTNTLLPKVSGNMMMNPKPCNDCGELTNIPSSTQTQHSASANEMISRYAAVIANGLAWNRKPSSIPYPATTAADAAYRTRSPTISPVNGLDRAIGRLRNRSKMPLVMSVLRLMPVPMLANTIVWTRMPGSTNCRYSWRSPPAMGPPDRDTNMGPNTTGCRLPAGQRSRVGPGLITGPP